MRGRRVDKWILPILAGLLLYIQPEACAGTVLDFEGFPDGTILTNQYGGLTFTNAIILTAGISLNEFEFPPHSGVNVVSDNGGPISISFNGPILGFSGYFTYVEPLTLDAFDSGSSLVDSSTSAFSSNDALFGDPGSSSNEFISLSFAGGISEVTITGDPGGGSFVIDDATFTSSVPEPNTAISFLIGVLGLIVLRRKFCFMSKKLLIGGALWLLLLAGGLYALPPSSSPTPPNPIVIRIAAPSSLPEPKLNDIVNSSGGRLLTGWPPTVLSSADPYETWWEVGVPAGTSERDTERVREALLAHPEITSAEISGYAQ